MIDHHHRIVFIHIHKTGGSSILQSWHDQGISVAPPFHRPLSFYCQSYGSEILAGYRIVTSVRNPWDRAVSTYAFLRNRSDKDLKTIQTMCDAGDIPGCGSSHILSIRRAQDLPFPRFIETCIHEPAQDPEYPDLFRCNWFLDASPPPQIHVIHFERLQQDFERICKELSIPSATLPNIAHGSSHDHYTQYHNSESKRHIAEYCAEDIERYQYRYEES